MFASVRGGAYAFPMQIDFTELIGIMAACCTTASFVPQVLHTWKTKSVDDISLRMYSLFTFGLSMWLLYGIKIGAPSIILANCVTLGLALTILYMKIRYSKKTDD